MATQLSVFLENTPGRLSALASALGKANINMHALVLADTSDFGVARIMCDNPAKAKEVLETEGLSVFLTTVCAVEIPDTPGALANLLELLASLEVDIAYSYCFVEPDTRKAVNVFKLGNVSIESELATAGFRVLTDQDLHQKG